MGLLVAIKLSDDDKLSVLRRLDRFRKWRSLDEKRYCLACGRLIDGHTVHVVGGTRGTGPLRVICPTHGCHSIPMDWVLPTDEVLARMSASEEERPPERQANSNRLGKSLAASMRKLAVQLHLVS